MGLTMRVSVESLYKVEVTEERSQIYHRMAVNQKYNTVMEETNVIL